MKDFTMSPIVERAGRFYPDRLERNKLYLTWLSSKDFSALRKTKNQLLLKKAWTDVKGKMEHYLKNYVRSLDTIINTFKKINLTIDPNFHCGYDPQKDALIFNLWSLFFSLTPDEFATPTPSWKTAGELIHEYDHYLFLRKSDMIGKTEREYEEFNSEHLNELEKRAYSNQIAFLEKCKKKVPSKELTYKTRIKKWSSNGKRWDFDIQSNPMSKNDVINDINQVIRQCQDILRKIETGKSYDDFSTEDIVRKNLKMRDILCLPIKLDPCRKKYPSIKIKM